MAGKSLFEVEGKVRRISTVTVRIHGQDRSDGILMTPALLAVQIREGCVDVSAIGMSALFGSRCCE